MKKGLKFIEMEKKKLERAKDEVYRARKLRKMLPQLERGYKALQRKVGVAPVAAKPAKGVEEVESLRERKERAFTEYLREEVELAKQPVPSKKELHPGIHSMIDEAREKLMQGNVDESILLVAEAENMVDKLKSSAERRLFMYDIRDLKASIKLASLA